MTQTSFAIAHVEQCWCGAKEFSASPHRDYAVCRSCGTAKLRAGLATGQGPVTNEESHLYGEHYWDEHMRELGFPSLAERARNDLTERSQYWLMHFLKYRLPPARVLEIGCAHGGFVKLLSNAGFDAMGMEMSPGVIEKAQEWFGVEVSRGPIEHADRPLGQFDAILMFDVIEHLGDPVGTMGEVVGRIAQDGLLVVQTPIYAAVDDESWRHFKSPEHTFLFSAAGLRALFRQLGFEYVAEEPAIFPNDMFVFASRRPLLTRPPDEIVAGLCATPDGRMAQAMQAMYQQLWKPADPDPLRHYGVRPLARAFVRAAVRAVRRRLRLPT